MKTEDAVAKTKEKTEIGVVNTQAKTENVLVKKTYAKLKLEWSKNLGESRGVGWYKVR